MMVTHRVKSIITKDNEIKIYTKGDANKVTDIGVVTKNRYVGKTMFSIPYIGYIASYLKSSIGLIILIANTKIELKAI